VDYSDAVFGSWLGPWPSYMKIFVVFLILTRKISGFLRLKSLSSTPFPNYNITYLRQQCHNSKYVNFSGEVFKGFEVL
jgi:hypothetical protein